VAGTDSAREIQQTGENQYQRPPLGQHDPHVQATRVQSHEKQDEARDEGPPGCLAAVDPIDGEDGEEPDTQPDQGRVAEGIDVLLPQLAQCHADEQASRNEQSERRLKYPAMKMAPPTRNMIVTVVSVAICNTNSAKPMAMRTTPVTRLGSRPFLG
jgi:hypothetical protein